MMMVFAAAGTVYVFIIDRDSKNTSPAIYNVPAEQSPLPKAVAPSPNAPEGVAIETLVSPVAAGDNSTVSARTNAGSSCTISVTYNGIAATDSGLAPQKADAYGSIQWSWTIPSSTPPGNWPIKIICVYNGRSGVVDGSLQVTKSQ